MCAFFHIIRYILKRQGSEEMAILTIKDLDFSYHSPQGETKALTDINLTVNEGEFISIVGPSGCGKSTLLSIIAGLTPVTGGFFVNNATIGYMLQRDHLFEWRTIYDNVILGLEIKKILTHENTSRKVWAGGVQRQKTVRVVGGNETEGSAYQDTRIKSGYTAS